MRRRRRSALDRIREIASNPDDVMLTTHAIEEAKNEGMTRADVLHALQNATEALLEDEELSKWKVYGQVASGEDLAVVTLVLRSEQLRVVTVHPPP